MVIGRGAKISALAFESGIYILDISYYALKHGPIGGGRAIEDDRAMLSKQLLDVHFLDFAAFSHLEVR